MKFKTLYLNKPPENEIKEAIPFTAASKGIKYTRNQSGGDVRLAR